MQDLILGPLLFNIHVTDLINIMTYCSLAQNEISYPYLASTSGLNSTQLFVMSVKKFSACRAVAEAFLSYDAVQCLSVDASVTLAIFILLQAAKLLSNLDEVKPYLNISDIYAWFQAYGHAIWDERKEYNSTFLEDELKAFIIPPVHVHFDKSCKCIEESL